jgi:hypothetical protein
MATFGLNYVTMVGAKTLVIIAHNVDPIELVDAKGFPVRVLEIVKTSKVISKTRGIGKVRP